MSPGRTTRVDPGTHRRLHHRGDDLLGEVAFVQDLGSPPAQQVVGLGQVRVAQHRADLGWRTTGKIQLTSAGEVSEPGGVVDCLLAERRIDDEALVSQPGSRTKRVLKVDRPPSVECQFPRRRRSRHADRQPAGDRLGERDGEPGLDVDEGVLLHCRRSGLPAVDGVDPTGAGVVVDKEPAAADPGAVRLGDAPGGRCRDRRVDRVAASPEHVQADLRRVRVDRRHGAITAHSDRILRRCLRGRIGRSHDHGEGGESAHRGGKYLLASKHVTSLGRLIESCPNAQDRNPRQGRMST